MKKSWTFLILKTDDMHSIFQTKLLKAIDKHAPFKILSQKEMKKKTMDNKTNTNKNKGKEQNL